jgi:hypothetical protein
MVVQFQKAVKAKRKLRLLIAGPSGSGKTYGALTLAEEFAKRRGSRIAFIDTEHGKSTLYSDRFDYDILEMAEPFTPERYLEAMKGAVDAGYKVVVVDSLSHEWIGTGGLLDIQSNLGGRFQDWKSITPRHRKFLESLISLDADLIATGRSKTDYTMGEDGRGKLEVKKVGTKLEQREGMEFEFDIVFKANMQHISEIETDHTNLFPNFAERLSKETAERILDWLEAGVDQTDAIEELKSEVIRKIADLDGSEFEFNLEKKSKVMKEKNLSQLQKYLNYVESQIEKLETKGNMERKKNLEPADPSGETKEGDK